MVADHQRVLAPKTVSRFLVGKEKPVPGAAPPFRDYGHLCKKGISAFSKY